jgi:UDP-N-acetylglucosamine 4-epimerase
MTEKWLVTGAAGFIGSNIVKKLLEDNQIVYALDNFSNGDYDNVKEFEGYRDQFFFYEGDIRNKEACEFLCNEVDYVLHQAALGSVPRSIDTPYDSNDSNVNGFLNIMIAARDAGVKKFVYASSGSVYGDSTVLPKTEKMIGDPLSPYAATKQINEMYAKVFNKVYDFDSVGLRYFNVYGPRQKFSGPYVTVIPTWCSAFIKGEDVFINGDGRTSRDFCYVEDVVKANILAAKSDLKGAYVFNVGAAKNMTLNDLFKLIKEKFGNPNVEPIYRDFRPGDARHTLADLTYIKEKLGYEADYTLYTALDKAIEWYKKKLK